MAEMAKTHGEKIDELSRLVATLTERVDQLREQVNELRPLPQRVAILEQQVADLKNDRLEMTRRLWMVLGPLIAGVLGAGITYYLGIKKG
jgi:outer membrane murein-binding lipoprotein Lpp